MARDDCVQACGLDLHLKSVEHFFHTRQILMESRRHLLRPLAVGGGTASARIASDLVEQARITGCATAWLSAAIAGGALDVSNEVAVLVNSSRAFALGRFARRAQCAT